MPQLQAHLSKNGRSEFLDALATNGIEFTRQQPPPGRVSASLETIVIALGVAVIEAVALVLIAWQRARASRTVIIQMPSKTIRLEGHSTKEAKEFVKDATSVTLIDTKKDDA